MGVRIYIVEVVVFVNFPQIVEPDFVVIMIWQLHKYCGGGGGGERISPSRYTSGYTMGGY